MTSFDPYPIPAESAGATVAAILRARQPGLTWNQARRLIDTRCVKINGEVWLDPARRLKEGDTIELLSRPEPRPHEQETILIRHLDNDLVVVEKSSGLCTVRHPTERLWSPRRRALSPSLEDIVLKLIAAREGRPRKGPMPRLRVVQRLDKDTSGLVVFARTVTAERSLGKQFHEHTVVRRYLAVVPGRMEPQTIRSRLVRDRGDGRRGSTHEPGAGKEAVTLVEVEERLADFTVLSCRLKTGRTHQIRIHLAERGHPVCGEKVYHRKLGEEPTPDASGAPRLALHAAELGFIHPVSGEAMHWSMPLPLDLERFLARLRRRSANDDH